MATLEERVSKLEAKMEEHSRGVDDLRGLISRVDAKIDRLDEKLDRRIDGLDQKLDRRIDGLDHRFSRQFNLLLVFHLTTLGAILVGLLTR